ncbi:MAG: hypothetical protein HRU32_11565, partial [Rhodobacteraceae bacterium]|nr:hypothetical protein [Paracoccaceae bacterium]
MNKTVTLTRDESEPHVRSRQTADELCIANAEIVLEDTVLRGAVHIADGRIAAVTEGDNVPAGAIDAGGDTLLP